MTIFLARPVRASAPTPLTHHCASAPTPVAAVGVGELGSYRMNS